MWDKVSELCAFKLLIELQKYLFQVLVSATQNTLCFCCIVQIFDINVKSAALLVKEALPHLKANRLAYTTGYGIHSLKGRGWGQE